MGNILRVPNGNALILTPRTGSHSMATAALRFFWPEIIIGEEGHPAGYLPIQEHWNGTNINASIIVRNPIERFRSMCAHKPGKTIIEHLNRPVYGPLPKGDFKYFLFESQLQECAEWLGLPNPLPHIDASIESNKPTLTPDQESIVRQIYAVDIALWESLQIT
jgi:hypothetical protein